MFNISGFLEKFKKIDGEKTLQKDQILKIVQQVLTINITAESFTIKNNILTFKGSPLFKGEVFMKKEELLALLFPYGIIDIR
jgi:hypothetical protein